MSWVKAIVRFLHAWRHPHEIAREVEAELRFHIAMRARANIEDGMKPDEAQLAALQSFGDFDRIKGKCCEISRSLPFDSRVFRMGLHIAIVGLAGGVALWAVNVPHHNFTGVWRQLVVIAILARLFVVVRRARSTEQSRNKILFRDVGEERRVSIASHDEQGRTPVERMFKSE
jgi:hypothetical protein